MPKTVAEKIRDHLTTVYITESTLITQSDLVDLKDIGALNVSPFIQKNDENTKRVNYVRFAVEQECPECRIKSVAKIGKAKLVKAIREGGYSELCGECKTRAVAQEEELNALRVAKSIEAMRVRTDLYIETYLDPTKVWRDDLSVSARMRRLQDFDIYSSVVAKHIIGMEYSEFLRTPYWKAISAKKKKDAGFKCQLCNGQGLLHTHHRTYRTHGRELHNMDDLIVLCAPCHENFHEVKI